jgi:Lar family restriction alleviation protein
MGETELKPCPFCCGSADVLEDIDRFEYCWKVFCVVCDGSTGYRIDELTAISTWNQRDAAQIGKSMEKEDD